jgi:hypothetical protein
MKCENKGVCSTKVNLYSQSYNPYPHSPPYKYVSNCNFSTPVCLVTRKPSYRFNVVNGTPKGGKVNKTIRVNTNSQNIDKSCW